MIHRYQPSDVRPAHECPPWPLSGWNQADWERIAFSDESGFHLCPDEHRRRVWRRPLQHPDPVFNIVRNTGLQTGVMYSGLIFQPDNAKPHTARADMNCLTAYQTLSWRSISPDPSPIEHVWDMTGS
ncbi:transposable element Tc1 transposase [Trichonephila clavipes]|nr:transposable element Tc1 transposase [Trichonephila clavipes]